MDLINRLDGGALVAAAAAILDLDRGRKKNGGRGGNPINTIREALASPVPVVSLVNR